MAKVNREKIKLLVGEIKQALKNLRDYSHLGMEKVLNDSTILGSIKYNFIVAIQSCIDICNHTIAKEQARAPEDYADCFKILGEMGIWEKDFTERLIQMERFRNLLVSLYGEVNNQKEYETLQKDIDEFDFFLEKLGKYLDYA
ncbi:MAG: hypothetical protein AMJ42_00995 [Deltaproteobacteria bacterium DG_8]|nr:MAG: hypothetical protein AMJ42_00995 [Deltaproteobacteria bacterium DG_8]